MDTHSVGSLGILLAFCAGLALIAAPGQVEAIASHVERTEHCGVPVNVLRQMGPFVTSSITHVWQPCDELVPLFIRFAIASKTI